MVDKQKISIKGYLGGLGWCWLLLVVGSKSRIGFNVIIIPKGKNDCKI
jgi:hypothetical protein